MQPYYHYRRKLETNFLWFYMNLRKGTKLQTPKLRIYWLPQEE